MSSTKEKTPVIHKIVKERHGPMITFNKRKCDRSKSIKMGLLKPIDGSYRWSGVTCEKCLGQ